MFVQSTANLHWYNEPPHWGEEAGKLIIQSGAKTDFWRVTHYDFIRDNGHFYYQEVTGDFTAEVKITGEYQTLYDQAGLMVRESETVWLKCGIEYVEEIQNISAVVTRNYSDWSVVPLFSAPVSLGLKLTRRKETVEVEYSLDGKSYQMLRLAYLSEQPTLQVGVMCASPQGDGFLTTFENLKIELN